MNLKNIIIGGLIICGIIALAFASGAYWQFERDRNAPGRTTIRIVEHYPIIPPKTETKPIKIKEPKDAQNQAKIDSLIVRARAADSLEIILDNKLQIRYTKFKDTIDVKDTCGAFYAFVINEIEYNPLTEIILKTMSYDSVKFTSKLQTIEKMIPRPFDIGGWLADWKTIGIIIALIVAIAL